MPARESAAFAQPMSLPRKRLLRRTDTLIQAEVSDQVKLNKSSRINAKSYRDGTLLDQLAKEHIDCFHSLFGSRRAYVPNREITIASACTGSASEVVSAHFFEKAVKDFAASGQGYPKFRIKPLFSCEVRDVKRAWIHGIHRQFSENEPCVFLDIQDLDKSHADCATHGHHCKVPSCDIFVCCTSCKDISRLSPASGLVLKQTQSPGGSSQTFHGMLAYIDAARPAIVIFENVEAINDVESSSEMSNMDILLSEFASRNYECQQMCGDSSRYGVPQKRMRVYVIALLVVANPAIDFFNRSIGDTFETLRSLIMVCQRLPPCASEILYSANDAAVLNNLKHRQLSLQKSYNSCYSVDKAITTSIASGVSWSAIQSPEFLKSSPWFPTLTPQQRHVAAFSLATDTASVLLRDISYSSGKARLSTTCSEGRNVSFTVTPKQVVLVFKEADPPRVLLAEEALLLQGFPVAAVSDLVAQTSNAALADLAGNMVSVPVMLALLVASVACVEWAGCQVADAARTPSQSASEEEVDVGDTALRAFRLLDRRQKGEKKAKTEK